MDDEVPYEDKIRRGGCCSDMPLEWPCWVGGDKDFKRQEQPFHLLEELKITTMREE